MRLMKMLGVAMVAVLAMAVAASAASAAEFHIEGANPEGTYTIKAHQVSEENHVFTIEGGLTTKCKTATFTGSQVGTAATTLEVHPTYGGCTAFGLSATIETHSCNYKFEQPTGSGPFTGKVDIVNCGTQPIQITAGTCEVTVGNQGPLSQVTYENLARTPKEVLVKAEVSGIKYTKVKDGFLCPLNGTGTLEGGTYAGNTETEGFEGVIKRGVFVG